MGVQTETKIGRLEGQIMRAKIQRMRVFNQGLSSSRK